LGVEQALLLGEDLSRIKVHHAKLLEALLSPESQKYVECTEGDNCKVYKINNVPLRTKPESRLIVVRDITETIENQKEIKQSEERYRRLYNMFRLMADNMPDMLWAKDLDLNYIFVNKAICDQLLKATDTEEPIGKSMEYFIMREQNKRPDDPKWFNFGRNSMATDDFILQTGQPGVFDELGTIDGKFTYKDVHKAPIRDENGRVLGIVGNSRDVTLQKKFESELIVAKERAEESNRLKTAFLANMSHEIRTPMNSILGFLSLMQEPDITKEEQVEYYKSVKAGGDRLLNTINDIIELSRIDSGELLVDNSEINVAEIYFILYSVFTRDLNGKDLKIINKFPKPTDNIVIQCDRDKLTSVLTNLLKNAVKYSKKGFIEVGCMLQGDRISFHVKDTGIGIPQDHLVDIFERFVQVDGSNTRTYEGSGLGLSIAKAYVEIMGGKIWVESVFGEGSTFFFELPVNKTA